MKCPVCGKGCIQPAKEVLAKIEQKYLACPACAPQPNLDKTAWAKFLPERVERCQSCKRATLDGVMLDALRLLQEFGLRDEDETLRSVGSPLIEVGYPLAYSPRLGPGSLIISGDRYSKEAAEAMLKQIPEIKGVILSRGVAGLVDPAARPQENVLMAGCDMRADISQSLFGETVIYKSQSRIHIEFSRQSAPKMRILDQLYLQGKLRDVVDGLCGPGTLGLMCVLAGARRVVLNDAWLASVQNVLLNLEANRSLLGIDEIEYLQSPKDAVGKEPVLVVRAHGACEIEVYHGDLARLFSRARPADVCLIDHFPGANTAELERACRCCKEIVIV
ncbi:MAG: methyltransferase [Methanothrix sp.]